MTPQPAGPPSLLVRGLVWRLAGTVTILLVAGLVAGRPDLVVLATPLALALSAGLLRPVGTSGGPSVTLRVAMDPHCPTEGCAVQLSVGVPAAAADLVVLDLGLPPGATVDGEPRVALLAREPRVVTVRVHPARWGDLPLGPVRATAYGPGLLTAGTAESASITVPVLPVVAPSPTVDPIPQALTGFGENLSRLPGEGTAFAAVRPYQPGDRPSRVNWRATARWARLHVDETLTERIGDVVLVVDSHTDLGGDHGPLDVAVRAAGAAAAAHLARGDSVQLLELGARVRWLPRLSGRSDLLRALAWLAGTRGAGHPVHWRVTEVRRVIPARALVLVFSPLLEERMATMVSGLRRRGQPVVVQDTWDEQMLPPPEDAADELAQRIWRLQRESMLDRVRDAGVLVRPAVPAARPAPPAGDSPPRARARRSWTVAGWLTGLPLVLGLLQWSTGPSLPRAVLLGVLGYTGWTVGALATVLPAGTAVDPPVLRRVATRWLRTLVASALVWAALLALAAAGVATRLPGVLLLGMAAAALLGSLSLLVRRLPGRGGELSRRP